MFLSPIPVRIFSVADVYRGWCKGLTAIGCTVQPFALHDRVAFYTGAHVKHGDDYVKAFNTDAAVALALRGLEAACFEFLPDVVVVISGFYTDEQVFNTIRARGSKVVFVCTESPYEDDKQLARAHLADLSVLNDPTNIDRYDNAVYLPHCYDPDIHRPKPAVRGCESEFFFAGTGYPSRIGFLERVDWDGIDVALGGSWFGVGDESPLQPFLVDPIGVCMDNERTADYYASTLTSANLYRVEANRPELSAGWAMGPREVELAACRRWFARNPRGEGDALFPMLPTFTEPEELGSLIRWAIAHPDEREDAALKAAEAVADRTFDSNAAHALHQLGF